MKSGTTDSKITSDAGPGMFRPAKHKEFTENRLKVILELSEIFKQMRDSFKGEALINHTNFGSITSLLAVFTDVKKPNAKTIVDAALINTKNKEITVLMFKELMDMDISLFDENLIYSLRILTLSKIVPDWFYEILDMIKMKVTQPGLTLSLTQTNSN